LRPPFGSLPSDLCQAAVFAMIILLYVSYQ